MKYYLYRMLKVIMGEKGFYGQINLGDFGLNHSK